MEDDLCLDDLCEDEAYKEVHDFVVSTNPDMCDWQMCTQQAWDLNLPINRLDTEGAPMRIVGVFTRVPTGVARKAFETLSDMRLWDKYSDKEIIG